MSHELVTENLRLRDQLATLLEQARCNQEIMRRHQTLDLEFIGASSFRDLIHSVFHTLPASSELDVVTLLLLDPAYDIRRILVDLQVDLSEYPNLLFAHDETEFGDLCNQLNKPVLGCYSEQQHGVMFPEPIAAPASVAVVPLLRRSRLIGCLNLGSFQETRFTWNMATDFIEHRASVIAICLENVINQERLKHIGLTDPLTGVNNRRYVERRILEEIGRTRRQGYALSCLYIDIDHFKQINDGVGHQGGDEVLREVARRIKAELRLSDALGRFGGEEFLVLLIDAELADAISVAERIRCSIAEQPLSPGGGKKLDVTVSIGVATLAHPDRTAPIETIAHGFIARADQALYEAKQSGRNRVVASDTSTMN
jgi:two-component system cell cycle response regulator